MSCLRCGKEFDSPYPEVVNPKGNPEIACKEWCSDCNALAMMVVFRDNTAYKSERIKGGTHNATP